MQVGLESDPGQNPEVGLRAIRRAGLSAFDCLFLYNYIQFPFLLAFMCVLLPCLTSCDPHAFLFCSASKYVYIFIQDQHIMPQRHSLSSAACQTVTRVVIQSSRWRPYEKSHWKASYFAITALPVAAWYRQVRMGKSPAVSPVLSNFTMRQKF